MRVVSKKHTSAFESIQVELSYEEYVYITLVLGCVHHPDFVSKLNTTYVNYKYDGVRNTAALFRGSLTLYNKLMAELKLSEN